jgi:hypothetical protein
VVIRCCKSKKERQYSVLKKKEKRTNNDYKTLCRKLKTDQHKPHKKPGGEPMFSGKVHSSCSTIGTHCGTPVKNIVIIFTSPVLFQDVIEFLETCIKFSPDQWVCVDQSLAFYIVFCNHCLSFFPFSLGHCIVFPSLIYSI